MNIRKIIAMLLNIADHWNLFIIKLINPNVTHIIVNKQLRRMEKLGRN